jgi:hypothetical protein
MECNTILNTILIKFSPQFKLRFQILRLVNLIKMLILRFLPLVLQMQEEKILNVEVYLKLILTYLKSLNLEYGIWVFVTHL